MYSGMKRLFICSEFYAGMMPYGSSIVNSFGIDENLYGIFICSKKSDYRSTLLPNKNFHFIDFPEGKISAFLFRVFPIFFLIKVYSIVKNNDIRITHLLTEDSELFWLVNFLRNRTKLLYTVHDATPHEAVFRTIGHRLVRKILVDLRVKYIITTSKNLITNSEIQYHLLKTQHPGKNLFYHSFPTLITNTISNGQTICPELNGKKDYILFFGRIESYKGVHILYDVYKNKLNCSKTLVIAGSGNIYFKIQGSDPKIIFINRYIADDELKYLFEQAFCVVYPYTSATQSGVISLSTYFGTPVITSNIPYFENQIKSLDHSFSFDLSDPLSLQISIDKISQLDRNDVKSRYLDYYMEHYDSGSLNKKLHDIYEEATL